MALMASWMSLDVCGSFRYVEERIVVCESLSLISMRSRSAVFLPMPGTFARMEAFFVCIASWSPEILMLLMSATAVFGPIPDTDISISNRSRSSLVRKP